MFVMAHFLLRRGSFPHLCPGADCAICGWERGRRRMGEVACEPEPEPVLRAHDTLDTARTLLKGVLHGQKT
jgi:hypothetical protein